MGNRIIESLTVLAVFAALAAVIFGCVESERERPVGEAVPVGEVEGDEKGGAANVRVAVYNACGVEGLAGSAADVLTKAGYESVRTANYVDPETGKAEYGRAKTGVFYGADEHRESAVAVAKLFGVAPENVSKRTVDEIADVALVLGADFDPTELVVKGGAETVAGEDFDWSAVPVEIKLGPPPDTIENGVYVSKGNHTVTLFDDGELVTQYPCAAGRDGCTPEGTFTVNMKLVDPVWYWKGEAIPPGPENGLGTRFLGITNDEHPKGYGIHGTNEPGSIGRDASHGCVRMHNEDVEELFEMVEYGDTVVVGP